MAALAALALLAASSLGAEPPPLAPSGALHLRAPLVEVPFTLEHGGQFPSMAQARDLAFDFGATGDWAIDWGFARLEPRTGRLVRYLLEMPALSAFGLLEDYTPGGAIWNHEEWHRAVLSHHGVYSHDDVLDLHYFAGTVSVSHERDEDLARFKAQSPADFVRMSAAGMEGDIELSLAYQKSIFFDRRQAYPDLFQLWYLRASVNGYMRLCDSAQGDRDTDAFNAQEPTIPVRDFTGYDCTGWAYDLTQPDEPYTARGLHPSGVGIDRYRKRSQLTEEGRAVLHQAHLLSYLNYVSPMLLGFGRLPGPAGTSWNTGLRHQLTSFGQVLSADLFFQAGEVGLFASYHHYLSRSLGLPGLELQLVRFRVGPEFAPLYLTPGAQVWIQPRAGRWADDAGLPGGLLSLSVARPLVGRLEAFLEGEAKTSGWAAGVVELGPAFEVRFGLGLAL